MLTTDEIDAMPGVPTSSDSRYEFTSAWALRGMEGRTIAKWHKNGWEFHTQNPGTLRTEITFRRVKPKNAWQRSVAFLAGHWAAFGRLRPRTQHLLLAASCGLVVLGLVAGIVVASVLEQGSAAPAASAASSAEPTVPDQAVVTPSQAPTPEPVTATEPYVYQGPQYEVIVADENVGPAALTQYWVLAAPFDYSTDEYKNQIRMIIADVAREHGSTELIVDVVTDREIAEAEAFSTMQAFVEEHGDDYFVNTIPKKEEEHWVASYTGGFDPDTVQPSDSADAYEIIWWNPYAPETFEQWQPPLAG